MKNQLFFLILFILSPFFSIAQQAGNECKRPKIHHIGFSTSGFYSSKLELTPLEEMGFDPNDTKVYSRPGPGFYFSLSYYYQFYKNYRLGLGLSRGGTFYNVNFNTEMEIINEYNHWLYNEIHYSLADVMKSFTISVSRNVKLNTRHSIYFEPAVKGLVFFSQEINLFVGGRQIFGIQMVTPENLDKVIFAPSLNLGYHYNISESFAIRFGVEGTYSNKVYLETLKPYYLDHNYANLRGNATQKYQTLGLKLEIIYTLHQDADKWERIRMERILF